MSADAEGVYGFTITEDLPAPQLRKDDVILIELSADRPVSLWRAVPSTCAAILPALLRAGSASADGSAYAALPEMVATLAGPPPGGLPGEGPRHLAPVKPRTRSTKATANPPVRHSIQLDTSVPNEGVARELAKAPKSSNSGGAA